MATTNVTLSCTGTGTSTVSSTPNKILSASGTSVPKLLKLPARTLSSTGTTVVRLLKLPVKSFSVTGGHTVLFFVARLGADTFDIIEGSRKWFIESAGKWETQVQKRFVFLVRGKPYG